MKTGGKCSRCNEPLSPDWHADHIIPWSRGGETDISNMQPMCPTCNLKKGSTMSFFDQRVDEGKMRIVQREAAYKVWETPGYPEWFSRPIEEISGRQYTCFWVTGAGKTLAMPLLAMGYNHMRVAREGWHSPRVKRILVLCKDSAIRDQTAVSLARDFHRYGILGNETLGKISSQKPPKVVAVNGDIIRDGKTILVNSISNQLSELQPDIDIVVGCLQAFWQKGSEGVNDGDGWKPEEWAKYADEFQMIFSDECHFGQETQVARLCALAKKSLWFSMTATPVDGDGELMKNYVFFSMANYEFTNQSDHCLKHVDSLEDIHFRELDIEEARFMEGINVKLVNSTSDGCYDSQIETAKSVACAVVSDLIGLEDERKTLESNSENLFLSLAKHRDEKYHAPHLLYPAHGIIVVDTIDTAIVIEETLNKAFAENRKQYPAKDGWKALAVYSKVKYKPDRPLTHDHPWYRSVRVLNGQLDAKCARVLIVVDMGREGVDNSYCTVAGVACKVQSLIEVVQRIIGRQIRSPRAPHRVGGKIVVPIASHDGIRIITHKAYQNRDTIEGGVQFVLNMRDLAEKMPTVRELEEDKASGKETNPGDCRLTVEQKTNIASTFGSLLSQGHTRQEIDFDLVAGWLPKQLPVRAKSAAIEWVNTLKSDPGKAQRSFFGSTPIQECDWDGMRVLVREEICHELSDNAAPAVIRKIYAPKHPGDTFYMEVIARYQNGDTVIREQIKRLHQSLEQTISDGIALSATTTLNAILLDLGKDVYRKIGYPKGQYEGYYDSKTMKVASAPWNVMSQIEIRRAAKKLFGVGKGDKLEDGSRFDTPMHHHILLREQHRLIDTAAKRLITKGANPNLMMALNMELVEVAHATD